MSWTILIASAIPPSTAIKMAPVAASHKEHENKLYWDLYGSIPPMKPPGFSESPRRKVPSRRDTAPLDRGSIHHFPSFVRGPLGNLFYDLFVHILKGFNQFRGRGENLVSRLKISFDLIIRLTSGLIFIKVQCMITLFCPLQCPIFYKFYP